MSDCTNSGNDKKPFGYWSPARRISRLYPDNDIKLYVKLRPTGCLHEVDEAFTIPLEDNQFYVGYKLNDKSGHFRQYCNLGRFFSHNGRETIDAS